MEGKQTFRFENKKENESGKMDENWEKCCDKWK